MRSILYPLSSIVFVVGCSSAPAPSAGTSAPPAAPGMDAGGMTSEDAGGSMILPEDAGMNAPEDAGMNAPEDAGMNAPGDASMTAEGGTTKPDAGTQSFPACATSMFGLGVANETAVASNTEDLTGIAAGDLNGDGKVDLLAGDDGNVYAYLNMGNGMFAPVIASSHEPLDTSAGITEAQAIILGDVNGDGKLDVLSGGDSNGSLGVALGNGDGSFQPPTPLPSSAGYDSSGLVAADFNGDGNLDLASPRSNIAFGVAMGTGHGTFPIFVDYLLMNPQSTVASLGLAVGDFNGDGKPDLVGETDTSIVIYLNSGSGTFSPTSAPTYALTGNVSDQDQATRIAAGDLNGDGKSDVVIAVDPPGGDEGTLSVDVLLNHGDATFGVAKTYSLPQPVPLGIDGVTIADLNNDGHPDIIFYVEIQGVASADVLMNNGDGTFPAVATVYGTSPAGGGQVAAADLTGNGLLGLAVTSRGENRPDHVNGVDVLLPACH